MIKHILSVIYVDEQLWSAHLKDNACIELQYLRLQATPCCDGSRSPHRGLLAANGDAGPSHNGTAVAFITDP